MKSPEVEEGERTVSAEAQAVLSVFLRDCECPLVFLPVCPLTVLKVILAVQWYALFLYILIHTPTALLGF